MKEVDFMSEFPACPQCHENMTYTDGNLFICPMCGHEWTQEEMDAAAEALVVRDSNGNPLEDGDNVIVNQEIKVSGSKRIKQGTKISNIRVLDEPVNDHNLECTVDGFGRMYLKSELVKKN